MAGKHGTIRSFDLNYRSKVQPDKAKARATNKVIMQHLDIVVGNQDDFDDALGFTTKPVSKSAPYEEWLAAYQQDRNKAQIKDRFWRRDADFINDDEEDEGEEAGRASRRPRGDSPPVNCRVAAD